MLYVLAVAISLGEEGAGHLDNSCVICSVLCYMFWLWPSLGEEGAGHLDSRCVICSGCGHLIRRRGSWSLG